MVRVRRSRRRRRRARARRRLGGVVALAMLCISAAALAVDVHQGNYPVSVAEARARAATETPAPAPLASPAPGPVTRAIFPYSVVPGGVHSVEELRGAIAQDPVVAEHYKDFDFSKAHIERLTMARHAYVSYRIGSQIFWTRKALVLPAGERVITDGSLIARTRCGNQVADRPGTTSPAEPAATVLDTPVALSGIPFAGFVPLPTSSGAILPGAGGTIGPEIGAFGLSGSGALPSTTPLLGAREVTASCIADNMPSGDPCLPPGLTGFSQPEMPVPVPEPGSLTLMATGAGLVARKLWTRRRN